MLTLNQTISLFVGTHLSLKISKTTNTLQFPYHLFLFSQISCSRQFLPILTIEHIWPELRIIKPSLLFLLPIQEIYMKLKQKRKIRWDRMIIRSVGIKGVHRILSRGYRRGAKPPPPQSTTLARRGPIL